MIGYKAFNSDFTCRGFQYEIGKTYEFDEEIELCEKGFHFCEKIADCFTYYYDTNARFAKVEALGEIIKSNDDSKCVTNKIKIIEEIPRKIVIEMSNLGTNNVGIRNTGDCNTGNYNTGDCNTGDCNVGYRNIGHRNIGNWNIGNYNIGNHNIGNHNTGDWNYSSFNSGCFMTIEPKIMLFNKQSDWTYRDWLRCDARVILNNMLCDYKSIRWIPESYMTDAEKADHPEYVTVGGYIKVIENKAGRQEWWDDLPENVKRIVMNLPNFDADIFYECTGIKIKEVTA